MKGSVSLARTANRRADGSNSRINSTVLPAVSTAPAVVPVRCPWSGEAGNKTRPDRIAHPRHHDGDFAGCLPGCGGRWRLVGDDDIDLQAHQFRSDFGKNTGSAFGAAYLQLDIVTLAVADPRSDSRSILKNCSGGGDPRTRTPIVRSFASCARSIRGESTSSPAPAPPRSARKQRRLIRSPRPHGQAGWGTSRPSALAVSRLMTRLNLVGKATGRSADLASRRVISLPCRTFGPNPYVRQQARSQRRPGSTTTLVASSPVQDLLLRANYLFVPAMMASASTWGARRSTLRFDGSQSPNESRMTRR